MNIMRDSLNNTNNTTNLFFLNIQTIVLCLLPLALILGSAIADILATLSSVIFLFLVIRNKEWEYLYNPVSVLFFTWSAYLLTSSLLSSDIFFSLQSSLFYWRMPLFALSIWYLLDKRSNVKKLFLYSITLTFSIILIDAYYQFFNGVNILGYPYYESKGRLSGLFGDELRLGNYLSRLMPILFALALVSIKKPRNFLLLLCFFLILIDVLVYLTGERSAFIILLITTFLMIILITDFKRIRIFTFTISIILILIITFFNDTVRFRMIENTYNQLNFTNENYVADHELFFVTSLSMFGDNPITGIGPKMYRNLCNNEEYFTKSELYTGCSTHPHFTYLQVLAETGIIGFLFLLSAFIFVIYILTKHFFKKYLLKEKDLTDEQVCLYISLFITLFPFIPTNSFFNNWISIIYFLPLGFLLNTYSQNLKTYFKTKKFKNAKNL